jgi:hypothetical protein
LLASNKPSSALKANRGIFIHLLCLCLESDSLLTFQQNPIDFAERQAEREQKMTMQDWAVHLDRILTMSGENVLQGAGNISHEQAVEKATTEYKKYQAKTLSEAEKNYLESLRQIEKISKKNET